MTAIILLLIGASPAARSAAGCRHDWRAVSAAWVWLMLAGDEVRRACSEVSLVARICNVLSEGHAIALARRQAAPRRRCGDPD